MKKIDLGQTISILANVGVVAGIVFLAIELRQNNELLEAEARASRNQNGLATYAAVYNNPTLAAILSKVELSEELTSVEEVLLRNYVYSLFRTVEGNFGEIQLGRLDAAAPIQAWRGNTDVPWRDYWDDYRLRASPDFTAWFEENVVHASK